MGFVEIFFLFLQLSLLSTSRSFCPVPACVASKQRWIRTRTLSITSRLLATSTNNATGLRGLPNNAFLNSFDEDSRRARQRSWDECFHLVKDYKKMFKTTRVKREDDLALSVWVSFQRCNKHSLSQEKIDLLNSIGFEWEKEEERNERRWQEKYEKLVSYEAEHGNCLVPARYDADPALGRWVHKQRTYKKQRRLQPKREKLLDRIGFVWRVLPTTERDNTHYDVLWETQYNKTVAFKETHGHCMIPQLYVEDTQLAAWVARQRKVYKRGDMRPDRVRKVNEIEFVCECVVGEDEASLLNLHWDTMFQRLKDFKAEKGHVNVPQSYEKFGLGTWVQTQRADQRNSKMSASRHKMLTDIGFQWRIGNPCTPWKNCAIDLKTEATATYLQKWIRDSKIGYINSDICSGLVSFLRSGLQCWSPFLFRGARLRLEQYLGSRVQVSRTSKPSRLISNTVRLVPTDSTGRFFCSAPVFGFSKQQRIHHVPPTTTLPASRLTRLAFGMESKT